MSRVHTRVCTGAQHPLYLYPLFWASAAAVHCAKDALYRDAQTVVAESLVRFGTGAVGVPVAEQHGNASKDAGKPVCVCVCASLVRRLGRIASAVPNITLHVACGFGRAGLGQCGHPAHLHPECRRTACSTRRFRARTAKRVFLE